MSSQGEALMGELVVLAEYRAKRRKTTTAHEMLLAMTRLSLAYQGAIIQCAFSVLPRPGERDDE